MKTKLIHATLISNMSMTIDKPTWDSHCVDDMHPYNKKDMLIH